MKFHQDHTETFIPDNTPLPQALARTSHLCVAAHQDDVEIMAAHAILECYQRQDKCFSGVIMTDGRGSPRTGKYANYTDEEMRLVRLAEQRKAAVIGEYAALIMLDYSSSVVKNGSSIDPVDDLVAIFEAARPQFVYTHNLADKHDTHVAVAMKVINAIRKLPKNSKPRALYGCEVWRGLDWMIDSDKVAMDLSTQENLQTALLEVFDSQINGGKRYDLATLARRRANATYFESHNVDAANALSFAMDLSPLLQDDQMQPLDLVQEHIQRFKEDVTDRLTRVG